MDILITSHTEKSSGPTVTIHCPACQAKSVSATSMLQVDQLKAFYLLPLFKLRNTFVKCSTCEKQLICRARFDQLDEFSAADLSAFLFIHVSLVNKLFAVLSIVLCWVPILSLLLSLISLVLNWKTTGWTRTCSFWGLGLSFVMSLLLVINLAIHG